MVKEAVFFVGEGDQLAGVFGFVHQAGEAFDVFKWDSGVGGAVKDEGGGKI